MSLARRFRNPFPSFALAIAIVSCCGCFAQAQEARGNFTLPFEVHCKNATLPAGQYAYRIDLGGPTPIVVFSKLSPKAAGFLLIPAASMEVRSGQSDRLVIEYVGGERVVASMYMHDMEIVFRESSAKTKTVTASKRADPTAQLDAKLTAPEAEQPTK